MAKKSSPTFEQRLKWYEDYTKGDHRSRYYWYIMSDEWKGRRQEVLDKCNGICQNCKQRSDHLEVHHIRYDRLGHEDLNDLEALCEHCHKKRHGLVEPEKGYKPIDLLKSAGLWDLYQKVAAKRESVNG